MLREFYTTFFAQQPSTSYYGKLVLNPIKEEPKVYHENDVLIVDTQLLVNPEAFIEDLRQQRMNELGL